jgi:hypothetical protein
VPVVVAIEHFADQSQIRRKHLRILDVLAQDAVEHLLDPHGHAVQVQYAWSTQKMGPSELSRMALKRAFTFSILRTTKG